MLRYQGAQLYAPVSGSLSDLLQFCRLSASSAVCQMQSRDCACNMTRSSSRVQQHSSEVWTHHEAEPCRIGSGSSSYLDLLRFEGQVQALQSTAQQASGPVKTMQSIWLYKVSNDLLIEDVRSMSMHSKDSTDVLCEGSLAPCS